MKNREKGFALPVALLLLVVMTLMGAALVSISVGDIRANNEKDYRQQFSTNAKGGFVEPKEHLSICKKLNKILNKR